MKPSPFRGRQRVHAPRFVEKVLLRTDGDPGFDMLVACLATV
jgi:hypothetical protein